MTTFKTIMNSIVNFHDSSVQVIGLYRLSHFIWISHAEYLSKVVASLNGFLTGASIHPSVTIGKDINFPHPIGVVIGANVIIGNNVTIFQNTTIGKKGVGRHRTIDKGVPKIGNKVSIGCGSAILGNIVIGDDIVVGANSVVSKNVPNHSTVCGVNQIVKSN